MLPAKHLSVVAGRFSFILAITAFCNGLIAAEPAVAKSALGINLSGPADWNTELPFIDVFHLSRAWISQKQGEAWGKGPPLELDRQGWVKKLEPNCFAETPLCTIDGGHYPSGEWTIVWKGEGKIELSKGEVISHKPHEMRVKINSQGGGFFLRLKETNPTNPVREIQVLMPGFTADEAAKNPWHPQFLARWRGFACLRFMDLQETNNSPQVKWADRPLPSDAIYTKHGVPLELLCDLANRVGSDPWFCIPHAADDDYIRQFAQLVKAKLNPQRKVYLEYSNEVWNGQFQQHRYAGEQGQKLGFAEKTWEAAWRYTAHRSVEIFRIWEEVFGSRARLVRVLASQAANAYVSSQIVGWKDAGKQADVLAIAPYISLNISPQGKELNVETAAAWKVEQVLDYAEQKALPECVRWMKENKKIADSYGLKLTCYEAGQHFVGVAGGENNDQLTQLLHAANRHPRLGLIYDKYYASWEDVGGDLCCHFSSISRWSKWGSWGLLQHADDKAEDYPKYEATIRWGKKIGQAVAVP